MPVCRLDHLVTTLQETLERSQAKVAERQAQRLRQVITVDRHGQPELLSWECRLPAGDGGEHNFSMLRLPWASLYRTETVDIAAISIELACRIKKTAGRDTDETPLIAIPLSREQAAHEAHHQLLLRVSAGPPEAEVRIDGEEVEDFFAAQFSKDPQQNEQAQRNRQVRRALAILAAACLAAAAAYTFLGVHLFR